MMQSFLNGLSGLLTFSKGLQNVSNNVSNMNTPGFRGSNTFYRSVSGDGESGLGSEIAGTEIRTIQGESRQTGNTSDAAINGIGYFVLKGDDGKQYFTRAGQFKLDGNNMLVDSVTKSHVQGVSASGSLVNISLDNLMMVPPKGTTTVSFSGNLLSTAGTQAIDNVKIVDSTGATRTYSLLLTNNSSVVANSWLVSVKDSTNTEVGTGEIRFGSDNTPLAGFNKFNLTLSINGQSQVVDLNFGDPGGINGVTQYSASTTTAAVKSADGSAQAGLTAFSFDENGIINLTYGNGETRKGDQLALAKFKDDNALRYVKSALYDAPLSMAPEIGRAGTGSFGQIQGGYIELSNVDLSQEFGDILIIQRGYQASSRVLTVSNEMVEQLYSNTRGG